MSARIAELRWGGVVLGEWRTSATPSKPQMPALVRQARQRRNSLSRLVKYRIENGLALGPAIAWAAVLGNTLAALRTEVTVTAVAALAARLGLPPIDPELISASIADVEQTRRVWSDYRLRTPAQVGAMLEVTSIERQECNLRDIDAADEAASDRKRRLARERQARRRAGAAPAAPRLTQRQRAQAAGVSLATWKRRQAIEPNPVTLSSLIEEERRARVREQRDGEWLTGAFGPRPTLKLSRAAGKSSPGPRIPPTPLGSSLDRAPPRGGRSALFVSFPARKFACPPSKPFQIGDTP